MFNEIKIFDSLIEIKKEEHLLIRNKVVDFAKSLKGKRQSEEYWENERKASNPVKDNIIGKYGEVVANLELRRNLGFPNCKIDFEIREGREKGWNVDLQYSVINSQYPDVHVKTCDEDTHNLTMSFKNDKYSWTFQNQNANGRGGRDSLLEKNDTNELVVFMYVQGVWEDYIPEVRLVALAPWVKIKNLLKDPIIPKYKNIKKCIYLADLIKASNEQ